MFSQASDEKALLLNRSTPWGYYNIEKPVRAIPKKLQRSPCWKHGGCYNIEKPVRAIPKKLQRSLRRPMKKRCFWIEECRKVVPVSKGLIIQFFQAEYKLVGIPGKNWRLPSWWGISFHSLLSDGYLFTTLKFKNPGQILWAAPVKTDNRQNSPDVGK